MGRGWREAPRASPFTLRCHWSLSRSLGHAPELACALSIYLSDTWKVPRVTRASRDSLGSNHRGDHNSSRDPSAAARVAIFSRGEDLQQRRLRAPVSSPERLISPPARLLRGPGAVLVTPARRRAEQQCSRAQDGAVGKGLGTPRGPRTSERSGPTGLLATAGEPHRPTCRGGSPAGPREAGRV